MKKVVIIFGYNNTRIYDIERIKEMSSQFLEADIMLCKEEISNQDKALTNYTLQVKFPQDFSSKMDDQINAINQYLVANNLSAVACLPFSDKGIPLGSYFASSKGLTHDGYHESAACIDKYEFRCLEAKTVTPSWYKKPKFKKLHSFGEAIEMVSKTQYGLFLKPMAEGNSRGCVKIDTLDDLYLNQGLLAPYFSNGVIAEECIKDCQEYSFDGVNGAYTITEKKTSVGHYRVETQHIVPAPLSPKFYKRLIEAGKIVAKMTGSRGGAVHHELFLNEKTGDVYCVEPNRRPGGLKIWDWIQSAYPKTDNWKSWIYWAGGKNLMSDIPKKQDYYVGCKMISAPVSGILKHIDEDERMRIASGKGILEIVPLKKSGSLVTSTLKDNSDFIGYVLCKHKDVLKLRKLLEKISAEVVSIFHIEGAT